MGKGVIGKQKRKYLTWKNNEKMRNLILIFFILILISCNNHRFDKAKWSVKEDLEYPYRNGMIKDLVKNHKLLGIKYRQIVGKLGLPEGKTTGKGDTAYYDIITDYGTIDPIYSKTLVLQFNNDSTVIDFKVDEWKE